MSRLTVLQASHVTRLAEVEALKTYLELDVATWDALLGVLLDHVTGEVETYLGRVLARQRYTEELPGLGLDRLFLTGCPVDPDSVSVLAAAVAETDFVLENRRTGELYLAAGWPSGTELDVSVTYWGGYLLPASVSTWSAGGTYALREWVRASDLALSPLRFESTVAGDAHGSTEPTWPTVAGDTVVDNEVTWTARAVEELPRDLELAAKIQAKALFETRGRPVGVQSLATESYRETLAAGAGGEGDLAAPVKRILNRYRMSI